jgi:thioredoxin 1
MPVVVHTRNLMWLAGLMLLLMGTGCGPSVDLNASTGNVKHVGQSDYADEVTRCSLPVVVEFYAVYNTPSLQQAPVLDRVAGQFRDKIKVVKINQTESPGLAQNFEIQKVPTILFFKGGKLAERHEGLISETDLTAKMNALVADK